MFYDETKQTMLSVEMRADTSIAAFAPLQHQLVDAICERLVSELAADARPTHRSRIASRPMSSMRAWAKATPPRSMRAARGARIHPRRFVCFGDSASDYAMVAELLRLGKQAELVFVGERHLLADVKTRHVTFTADAATRARSVTCARTTDWTWTVPPRACLDPLPLISSA